MDNELVNYGMFLANELRAMMIPDVQLYQSGNMRSSVAVVVVDDTCIDVIIATNYASYTNERGRMKGWVERTVDRVSRCYSEDVGNDITDGFEKIGENIWKPKD